MGANPLRVSPQRACVCPSSLSQTQALAKCFVINVLAPRTVLALLPNDLAAAIKASSVVNTVSLVMTVFSSNAT